MARRSEVSVAAQSMNEVHLIGRMSGAGEVVLPSGDPVATFRIVVDRPEREGRAGVDALECVGWLAAVRRRAASLGDGEWVEATGHLRRRFWRAGDGPRSRVEVEVRSLRRLT